MVTVTGKGPYPKEKTSVLDCFNDSNLSALFSDTEDSTLSDVRTVEMGISEENYTPWKTNLEREGWTP